MGRNNPQSCPHPLGDPGPHLTRGSLGPPLYTTKTASRSGQASLCNWTWSLPVLYNGAGHDPQINPSPGGSGSHVIHGYKTMEATRSRHGWVHMFITHRPTVTLQLHNFDFFRTCRTSSFCTVAWQLARFQLTRRIARSLGDSWASCLTRVWRRLKAVERWRVLMTSPQCCLFKTLNS